MPVNSPNLTVLKHNFFDYLRLEPNMFSVYVQYIPCIQKVCTYTENDMVLKVCSDKLYNLKSSSLLSSLTPQSSPETSSSSFFTTDSKAHSF